MSAKLLSLSVFLLVYVVYHLTLIPSVPGGDSGELLAESCLLGTPHPPGYPLFTVISQIVEKVSFSRFYLDNFSIVVDNYSSLAWQVNHICAVFGALAASFICLSAAEIVKSTKIELHHKTSVALGAVFYAFSPLVWEYSTTAEVFALNNCLCSTLIYLACKVYTSIQSWSDADEANRASRLSAVTLHTLLGALVSGLALSNQHASLLQVSYLIPYILYLLFISRVPNLLTLVVRSGLCFLLGLSPYAYLVLASMRPTPGSWGDQSTISGFLRHVLRSEYGTFQLGVIVGKERAVERIVIYLGNVSAETRHALFPVILVGFIMLYYTSDLKRDDVAVVSVTTDSFATKNENKPNNKGASKKSNYTPIKSKSDTINTKKGSRRSLPHLSLALSGLWLFYTLVWHCVLSNLPLSSPMPFAVHSRFWMQPNIVLYILMGVGCCMLSNLVALRHERVKLAVVTSTPAPPPSKNLHMLLFDLPVLVGVISVLMFSRFALQDRSQSGVVMRQYASLALSSLPSTALLLSHTDLDWNPVRYLQHCEGQRPDVTHLSFQLMPYPWFAHKQAALYPHVRFTPQAFSFPGVSAERSSEGNARMIRTFLSDNGIDQNTFRNESHVSAFPGGIFLDMQSINEVEIGALSAWRGLYLQPWGTLYRVYSLSTLTMEDYRDMQHASVARLEELVKGFPVVDARFIAQYPAGTWEFAAASVFCDAHYQLGLNLLTYSMELQKNVSMEVLPLLLDRLLYANRVLSRALQMGLDHGIISSSLHDLHKNSALSSMRLHAVISIVSQYQKETLHQFYKQLKQNKGFFLAPDAISTLLTVDGIASAQNAAIELMGGFVAAHPTDRDASTFRSVVDN